jgi:hypothetical protein
MVQVGVAGAGEGGTLLPLLGALVIVGLLIALWRTQPKKASCPADGSAGTKAGKQGPPASTFLGLTPQEVLIVAAFIAAAIIAGLTLGGMLGT